MQEITETTETTEITLMAQVQELANKSNAKYLNNSSHFCDGCCHCRRYCPCCGRPIRDYPQPWRYEWYYCGDTQGVQLNNKIGPSATIQYC